MAILKGCLLLGEWRTVWGRLDGELPTLLPRGDDGEVGAEPRLEVEGRRPLRDGGERGSGFDALGGELKGRDLGLSDPPERSVIGPEGLSVGEEEEEAWRLRDDSRRGRRVSSRSLMVRMWWDLDTALPGEGRGLDVPPAGLRVCRCPGVLDPDAGSCLEDGWRGVGAPSSGVGLITPSGISISWLWLGLWAMVLLSSRFHVGSPCSPGRGLHTSVTLQVYLQRLRGSTVLQYKREHW